MSLYKVIAPEYRCKSKLCRLWNHWLNPLGAWIEPLPTPKKRAEQAKTSWLPAGVWWWLRNPAQNLMHHWLGIVPLGARYEWHDPRARGWARESGVNVSWWRKRSRVSLPYYHRQWRRCECYAGWTSRGNLGFAFRRVS